eukprot:349741-Chlamydomonas_euryale.AAC.3
MLARCKPTSTAGKHRRASVAASSKSCVDMRRLPGAARWGQGGLGEGRDQLSSAPGVTAAPKRHLARPPSLLRARATRQPGTRSCRFAPPLLPLTSPHPAV